MSLLTNVPFKKIDAVDEAGADAGKSKAASIASFIKEVDFEAYAALLNSLTAELHDAAAVAPQSTNPIGKKLARIVGNDEYLKKLRMILGSAGVNSVRIEGKRGIGKTSVVDGLLRLRAERRVGSKLMSKPAYVMDVSTFFKMGRADWVEQFEKATKYIFEHKGLLVIDHFDDLVRMADGEAPRLVNTLVSALENNDEMQSIILTESDQADVLKEIETNLGRRFEKLSIEKEVDSTLLKQILLAQFPSLKRHHNVDLGEEVADEIIRFFRKNNG
jgi:ATP-dependent Clp protease ATP-binding subunit ClpA